MPKKITAQAYWSMINKLVKKYNLTLNDFKTDPVKLYAVSPEYRSWLHKSIKEPSRMRLANNKDYDMLTAIANHPDKERLKKIMFTEAPKEWYDERVELASVEEQRALFEEFNSDWPMEEIEPSTSSVTDTNTKKPSSTTSEQSSSNKRPAEEPIPGHPIKATIVDQKGTKRQSKVDEHFDAKKPNVQRGKTTKHQDSTQVEQKKATSLTGTTTSQEPTQSNPTGSQQVDTPSGPAHNQGGTVQGEAGNRKVQKPERRFGLIEVMATKNTKTFVFGFKTPENAEAFLKLLNIIYPNQQVFTYKYTEQLSPCTRDVFFVLMKLSFNIGYTTLKNKVGTTLDNLIYFWHHTINWIDDHDEMKKIAHEFIDLHVVNKVKSLVWEEIMEAERTRKAFAQSRVETKTYTVSW